MALACLSVLNREVQGDFLESLERGPPQRDPGQQDCFPPGAESDRTEPRTAEPSRERKRPAETPDLGRRCHGCHARVPSSSQPAVRLRAEGRNPEGARAAHGRAPCEARLTAIYLLTGSLWFLYVLGSSLRGCSDAANRARAGTGHASPPEAALRPGLPLVVAAARHSGLPPCRSDPAVEKQRRPRFGRSLKAACLVSGTGCKPRAEDANAEWPTKKSDLRKAVRRSSGEFRWGFCSALAQKQRISAAEKKRALKTILFLESGGERRTRNRGGWARLLAGI